MSLASSRKGFLFVGTVLISSSVVAADPPSTKNMTIDQRLSRLERIEANQNFIELFNRIEAMQREIETVRGELEVVSHDVRNLKKQQKDIYNDLDKRMQSLETQISQINTRLDGVGRMSSPAPTPSVSSSATPASLMAPIQEQEAYQKAFNLIKENKYTEAINQFQVFLLSYPDGQYADNAQYWMAESYYVLRDFKAATLEFNKVISKYPRSAKVPDAYLKLGFCNYELQDFAAARRNLLIVTSQFSDTSAAKLAERRLEQLKVEGH